MHYNRCLRTISTALIALSLAAISLPSAFADAALMNVPASAALAQRFGVPSAALSPSRVLHVTFMLKTANSAAVDQLITAQNDPASPLYHQWLTPNEFGQRFGADKGDISAVTQWAAQNGMTVTKIWPNRRFISADVSVKMAQATFHVALKTFGTAAIFGPDKEPSIPADIASRLEYIGGLTNALQPHRAPAIHYNATAASQTTPNSVTTLSSPLTPAQISKIYDMDRLQTAGYTGDAIKVGVYSPTLYHQSDIATFEQTYSISAPTPIEKWPASSGRATDYSDADEAALDVETLIGQVPDAQVVLYEAPNNATAPEDEFNQIASDNPPVVSFSYTFTEDASSASGIMALNSILQQMATQGMTVLAASGDGGPYEDGSAPPNVGFPASSPYATGVGGTTLPNTNSGYWNSEVAWVDTYSTDGDNSSSGGGNSSLFNMPSWQVGVGVQNSQSNGMRQVPDVAAIAGSPGLRIYANGQWEAIGGTSTSTPIWAAAAVAFNQSTGSRLGNLAPLLYNEASDSTTYAAAFHDITSGRNQLYSATPGWDYLTGLGSSDFYELALALSGTTNVHTFASGLQMISAPFIYAGSPSQIFSTPPTLAYWQPDNDAYAENPSTLTPGKSYWVLNTEPNSLITMGGAVPNQPFSMTLPEGWNMIADPFIAPISIGSLQVQTDSATISFASAATAGYVSPTLYSYDTSSQLYDALDVSSSLHPYNGYWIYIAKPCTLIVPAGS